MRWGMSPAADSRIQPECCARTAHRSQTWWRCPPGARYASVRSPLRIVRPQTSQVTTSWTGRSSFFIAADYRPPATP